MHFTSAFIAAAAIYLAPLACAQESVADIERPTFTPTNLKADFLEQFTNDWESRWQASHAKKTNDKSTEEEWAYVGNWAVEEPTVLKGIKGDKGLVLKDKAAHHAISAKFPRAIDNTGKDLVVQYEVKLQDGLECGGAYMKLLQDSKALHAEEFSNASPYIIMFGPDKCGSTNKVHFIFRHKNPKTGEYEEKHMKNTPMMKNEKTTSLYTLIVKPDQTFQIKIDGESMTNGSLLEDFAPPVNPPTEIDDAKDTKPADWIDTAKIVDPESTKPEDWDENAPFQIIDEAAEKPDDWLEDEPSMIPDPEAQKPEDWDDEEDGDFAAPMVPNPKCADASGCGPWEKPMMSNPEYKGKWNAPMIDNPAYKGVWKARKISNPDFFEDKTPANFEPMGAIGFELWTMQKDILFDNIYIGHSIADAEALKKETYDVKIAIEKKEQELTAPKIDEKPKSPLDLNFMENPVNYVKEKFNVFMSIAKRSPIEAIKSVPEVAGGLAIIGLTTLALLAGLLGLGASSSPQIKKAARTVKVNALDAKDQAAEAVSTAADNVQAQMHQAAEAVSTGVNKVQSKMSQARDQAADAVSTGADNVQAKMNQARNQATDAVNTGANNVQAKMNQARNQATDAVNTGADNVQAKMNQARMNQAEMNRDGLDQIDIDQGYHAELSQADMEQAAINESRLSQARMNQAQLNQGEINKRTTRSSGATNS